MEKITGFIITAGHLDIEWYQPLNSYRFWTVETLEDLKQAAKRSDFKTYVLDGQVFRWRNIWKWFRKMNARCVN